MLHWLKTPKSPAISVLELVSILRSSPKNIAFIDVRENDEWDSGHIAGFEHIPLASIGEHVEELAQKDGVYFLCHTGGRSGRACEILEHAGYKNAVNISGGIVAWKKAGFNVIT